MAKNLSGSQTDMVQACASSLEYKAKRDCLDLQKKEAEGYQKLFFREQLQGILVRSRAQEALQRIKVYKDAGGQIMVAIADDKDAIIVWRRLLNVRNFTSKVLFSSYLKRGTVLEISWEGKNEREKMYFPLNTNTSFLRYLKRHGVFLPVSGRTEKGAADALLEFSLSTAEMEEIPYTHGWWRTEDGKWRFSDQREVTITEVEQNE